jgi:type IV pilus assembly protein PilQ
LLLKKSIMIMRARYGHQEILFNSPQGRSELNMKRLLNFLAGGEFVKVVCVCLCLGFSLSPAYAQDLNVIKSLVVQPDSKGPSVNIQTELPVGYRYTVYDSFDPVRVVVDFPGMDTSALNAIQSFAIPPVHEVRVSSFDLESGKLGRIEILLDQATNYEIELTGTKFQVVFTAPATNVSSPVVEQPAPVAAKAQPPVSVPSTASNQVVPVETTMTG